MRTVVLGAPGQLGRDLCPRLTGEVIPLARADADLTDFEGVRAKLAHLQPDVVVNCAAYNLVDKAESEPDVAFAVNAWGVRNLALVCRDLDASLVHFSTDYVFGLDRDRAKPLSEDDLPGPLSVYGLSKLAGEYVVRALCRKHFVIRTCGLFGVWGSGGKGGNFVETMLRLAGQGRPIRVVHDQRCTPSSTVDVATAVAALLATGKFGLYHITNSGDCSWYDFAAEIFRAAGIDADLKPVAAVDFGAAATRPPYSVLSNEKLRSLGISPPESWQDALAEYLRERTRRQKL